MENNKKNVKMEYDECLIKGICSTSPVLSSTQAVILVYLGVLCFYMHKLYLMGVENELIKKDILETCYGLSSNVEYQKSDLIFTISHLYKGIYQAKGLYQKLCKERGLNVDFIKTPIKIAENFNFTEAIKQGQKYFDKKNAMLEPERRNLYDLFLVVLNSIVIYMSELEQFGENINQAYVDLISALSNLDFNLVKTEKIQSLIDKYVKIDHELMQKTYERRGKLFGQFMKSEISTSNVKGKSILVTGMNLTDLQNLLEATKDKDINIYTHGHMSVAHMFPEFKKYEHLKGHLGKGMEYVKSDFSNFPGPVFLTKLSLVKAQNFFSSTIFTTDKIATAGVSKIEDDNFEPLIDSALKSEGFHKDAEKNTIKVGFDEVGFWEEFDRKLEQIKTGEIKHIITIGVSNKTTEQYEYFKEFLKLLDDTFFVFSFSYLNPTKNILFANIDYGFPVLYKALNKIKELKNFDEIDVNIMFTRCEPHTIPNLFYLKSIGVKNIFFSACSPNLFNPAIVSAAIHKLGINIYTTPQEDYEKIISKGKPKENN